ncbi:hypothetical protein G7Y79_00058g091140 [Physcia stellaris]|nr:hypothetical protein G7Y79_00058g091140 [Physcia stellaris]
MYLTTLAALTAAALALPNQPSCAGKHSQLLNDLPDSPQVIEALSSPSVYEQLAGPLQQIPLEAVENVFAESSQSSTCNVRAGCPAYEGKNETLNGPKSLEECEAQCHKNSYDCNGLTFYPSTGACTLIYSKDSEPYIWDNGYQKIGAIPADAEPALSPAMVCPLPKSDNQAYKIGPHQFKLSCTNQLKVPASAKKNLGTVKTVDECAKKCGEAKCHGFHYYQPIFPGGRSDGLRTCEIITQPIEDGQWTPIYKANQYLTGLKC